MLAYEGAYGVTILDIIAVRAGIMRIPWTKNNSFATSVAHGFEAGSKQVRSSVNGFNGNVSGTRVECIVFLTYYCNCLNLLG